MIAFSNQQVFAPGGVTGVDAGDAPVDLAAIFLGHPPARRPRTRSFWSSSRQGPSLEEATSFA